MPPKGPAAQQPQFDYLADFYPYGRRAMNGWLLPLANIPAARKNLFTIVGNRNGQPSVTWPGVARFATLLATLYCLINLVEHLAFGWELKRLPDLIVTVFVYTGISTGLMIWLGLKLPPERLPKLD